MSSTTGSASPEILAARAQLLTLRATLPDGIAVPRDRVKLLPDARIVTDHEIEEILAARPKPLNCIATIADGLMALRLELVDADNSWLLDHIRRTEESDPHSGLRLGPEAVVLIKGKEETIWLPGAAYRAWRWGYQPPGNLVLGGQSPSDEERAQGITAGWSIGTSDAAVEVHSLTSDTQALCEHCRNNSAVTVVIHRDRDPQVTLLLCRECFNRENMRAMVSFIGSHGTPPFTPDVSMSDEQVQEFFADFGRALEEATEQHSPDPAKPSRPDEG